MIHSVKHEIDPFCKKLAVFFFLKSVTNLDIKIYLKCNNALYFFSIKKRTFTYNLERIKKLRKSVIKINAVGDQKSNKNCIVDGIRQEQKLLILKNA